MSDSSNSITIPQKSKAKTNAEMCSNYQSKKKLDLDRLKGEVEELRVDYEELRVENERLRNPSP
jgi:hypothetical protein